MNMLDVEVGHQVGQAGQQKVGHQVGQAGQQKWLPLKVGHQVGQVGQVHGYWMMEVDHLKNHQVEGFLSAPQSQLLHSCFKIKKYSVKLRICSVLYGIGYTFGCINDISCGIATI